MIPIQLDGLAQLVISRVLNSVPEGILIALLAWLVLRLTPRQNSGTRFVVWFVTLVAVAALPWVGGFGSIHPLLAANGNKALFTLPGHWGLLLFGIWVAAALTALLRLALGIVRLHSLQGQCRSVETAGLDPEKARTLADFCADKSIAIATSESINVPAAIGFLRPTIVIPQWALRELTPEKLRAVLLHEAAHIKRLDPWTNLLQKSVRALLPFHPAVWWIERQLTLEREMACDDHVLAKIGNPRGYAECLISLLERSCGKRALALAQAAVDRAREARLRLSQILDSKRSNTSQFWKPAIGLVGTLSVLCVVVVPWVPRFVAFSPSSSSQTGLAQVPVSRSLTTSSEPAMVVPATMRASSQPRVGIQRGNFSVSQKPRQLSHTSQVAARHKSDLAGAQVIPARANLSSTPYTETILVIHTTRQVGPDEWEWSVRVLHLTFVPRDVETNTPSKTT